MPKHDKNLKRLTRARMAATGERYSTARARLTGRAGLDQTHLGNVLRDARTQRAWALGDAAKRIGISRLLLDLFERGQSVPSVDVADRLCRVYDLPAIEARGLRDLAQQAERDRQRGAPDEAALGHLLGEPLRVTCADGAGTTLVCFAVDGDRIFTPEDLGDDALWIRALNASPEVALRSLNGHNTFTATTRRLDGDDRAQALSVLGHRYFSDLDWLETCLLIEVRLHGVTTHASD